MQPLPLRLIVTGALGHIGSRLIRELAARYPGIPLILIDNLRTQRFVSLFGFSLPRRYTWIESDILDVDFEGLLTPGDCVIHLAAISDPAECFRQPDETERINILGTRRIAEACVKKGARLIFISTTTVYGQQSGAFHEKTPLMPAEKHSVYTASKWHAEALLRQMDAAQKWPCSVFRFGTVFGVSEGMRFHTAVNKFCWQALTGRPLSIYRNALDQTRPYLALEDAVHAICHVLDHGDFNGTVYNAVTCHATVREILELISLQVPDLHIELVDSPVHDPASYQVECRNLVNLNFTFRGSLVRGIGEIADLFRTKIPGEISSGFPRVTFLHQPEASKTDDTPCLGFSPKASYETHRKEIHEAIERVLDRGVYVLGREVDAFEREFAQYVGTSDALGVASGTDALQIALRACGIEPGEGVITPAHGPSATVSAILLSGATPVLIDVGSDTLLMDPSLIESAVHQFEGAAGKKVRAIVPIHLYGYPADMPALCAIADKLGLQIIEDCAQATGASILDKKLGTWGRAGIFSFYPTKNLSAIGDGGAIVTSDVRLAEKIRLLRQYGWRQKHYSEITGMNSRLDELQAAILRVKLKTLGSENQLRTKLAHLYHQALSQSAFLLLHPLRESRPVYNQYVIRSPERDRLKDFLVSKNLPVLIHYPHAIHEQPAFQKSCFFRPGFLSESEKACRQVLSLPVYPEMSGENVQQVTDLVTAWVKDKNTACRPS